MSHSMVQVVIPGHDLTRFCWALRAPSPTPSPLSISFSHTQGSCVGLLVSSSVRHTHTHIGLDSSVSSLSYLATLKAGSECWTPRRAIGCWVKASKSPGGHIYCPGREGLPPPPTPGSFDSRRGARQQTLNVTRRQTGVGRLGHRTWRPLNHMARKQEDRQAGVQWAGLQVGCVAGLGLREKCQGQVRPKGPFLGEV